MGYVRSEDIAAIRIGQEVVCGKCWSDDEFGSFEEDDVITSDDIERADEGVWFCDRCKHRIG